MKEREVYDGIELPDEMPRLSDAKIITKTSQWHPRLESMDRLIAEFPYLFLLIRENWTRRHLLAISLAILGSIVGAWDLGIGELASGGDYNYMGINLLNPEAGILQAHSIAILLTILAGFLWIGSLGVNWVIYPLMRSHSFYLIGGFIAIQIGMISAHTSSPSFPSGNTGFSDYIGLIVAESVLAFILTVIIHRSATETRDLHVEIHHSHPDPREQERAIRDHSLGGWTLMLFAFALMVNISAWAGVHHISPRPPFESSRLATYFLHLFSTWFAIVLFNLILWYPQFMLGSSTVTIESERARQTSTASIDENTPGSCPNCGEASNAKISDEGIIIGPCEDEDCNSWNPIGQDCNECGKVIPAAIYCNNCGHESTVSELFPVEEAW